MFILLIITIMSGIICGLIATHKQQNPSIWFFYGCIFGPLAIPFIVLK